MPYENADLTSTHKVSICIDVELFVIVSILSYSGFVLYSVLNNINWKHSYGSRLRFHNPLTLCLLKCHLRQREDLAIKNMHDSFRGPMFDFQHPQSGCS